MKDIEQIVKEVSGTMAMEGMHLKEEDKERRRKEGEREQTYIEEIKVALRKGVLANKIVPVLKNNASQNKGVQLLLDAIIEFITPQHTIKQKKQQPPTTGEEMP
ncbi:hypothetical protein CFK35_19545, partial [Clostridium sp. cpc1]|nr:hypothetical protein [Clostridium sp. cpc1]